MKQIVVTLDSPEIKALEKEEGSKEVMKEAMAKVTFSNINLNKHNSAIHKLSV